MSIVTCPKCGAKNRVDERRASEQTPKCGKCGSPLPVSSSSDGHPVTITDDNFAREVLQAGATPVLVDAWATWCPPCRALAPTIDQLAAESGGRYRVGKLNVDENPRVAGQFRIESIPTMLIFKNGQLVDKLVGLMPKPAIESKLQQWR
ncbi:MAG TPA: thioredoxin [Tepidisphaeraceae bacterium]|nr:thioredoxin [Tepidisphaeraceae bacterium]